MLTSIYNAIEAFTNWAWSWPVLVVLIGGGIIMTIATDFVQFKHLGIIMKSTFLTLFKKKEPDARKEKHEISGYRAMTAALSSTIGTGNIVGVGTAIALGGPGAVFWLWLIGLIAMALKFSEVTLAVYTREKDPNGGWRGGAFKYLSDHSKIMGWAWAVCFVFSVWIGAGVHTGSVATAAEQIGIPRIVTIIILAVVVTLILFGGFHMLTNITATLVPVMVIIYVVAGLLVIALNIGNLIPALGSIFSNAFTGTSAVGGFAGATFAMAIKNGCARGMYSNASGTGEATIAHSQADTDDPVKQGMWGVFEVFVDTIIVCTFTALVILTTGVWTTGASGSTLAIDAFTSALGGVGKIIASVGLILFAGSTVLAFCANAGILAQNLLGKTAKYITQIVYIVLIFVGGTIGVDRMLMWADFANVFLAFLNIIGLLMMVKVIHKLTHDYFKKEK